MVPNSNITDAFQLLASVVREFHSISRPSLGATIKPAVCTRGNFNELTFGFRKFGDFLRAAEAAGYVQLRPTAGGDISVWPASGSIPPPLASTPNAPTSVAEPTQPQQSPPSNVRVRQDLWNAFNSFSGRWVYDPTTDVAFKEVDASTWNAPGIQRPNVIPIPGGRERVIEWMRSFANTQDAETRATLNATLSGDGGPYQFNNLVRSKNLLRAWNHFLIQQVLAAIDAWAAPHHLQLKNVTLPFRPLHTFNTTATVPTPPISQPTPLPVPPEPTRTSLVVGSALTGRLESLVDELIEELFKLRGLLQVVGPKQR